MIVMNMSHHNLMLKSISFYVTHLFQNIKQSTLLYKISCMCTATYFCISLIIERSKWILGERYDRQQTIMKAQCTSTVLLAALILLLSSLSSVLAFTPHHTISGSIRYHQQKLISMNSSSNDDTPASHPRTVDHHPFCDLPGDP